MKKLAVLDFDGTIYKGDSMLDFAKFLHRKKYFTSLFILSFRYPFYLIGLISRNDIKAFFVRYNFSGYSQSDLKEKGIAFFNTHQHKCYPSALEWIKNAQVEYELIVLSGSCPEWLAPFAQSFGAQVLGTVLTYDNNSICTGELDGKNVTGPMKVQVLKTYLESAEAFEHIIGFGDQKSDLHLEDLCDKFHLNYFSK